MCGKALRRLRPCSMDFYLDATKIYKLTRNRTHFYHDMKNPCVLHAVYVSTLYESHSNY